MESIAVSPKIIQPNPLEKENYIQEKVDYDLLSSMKYTSPPTLTCKQPFQLINKYLDGKKQEPVNEYIPRIPPAWLKYDRQVTTRKLNFNE
jgi:hypothetical protein